MPEISVSPVRKLKKRRKLKRRKKGSKSPMKTVKKRKSKTPLKTAKKKKRVKKLLRKPKLEKGLVGLTKLL